MRPALYPLGGITLNPPNLGSLNSWFQAYDNTTMSVNNNGSGGTPASGGLVGRWLDLSGNGNHVSANANDNTRPMFRTSNGLNFRYDVSANQSVLHNGPNLSPGIPSQDTSGGMLLWLPGNANTALVDYGTIGPMGFAMMVGGGAGSSSKSNLEYFNGAVLPTDNTNIAIPGRRAVVCWRSNATNLVGMVNGVTANMTPFAVHTMISLFFGTFAGGAQQPIRLFEVITYNNDIGASKLLLLNNYLREQANNISSGDPTNTVITFGDSLTQGIGSNSLIPWHDPLNVSNRPNSLWYTWGTSGQIIFGQNGITAPACNALKGSSEGVVVVWLGTNDILNHGFTGASTETQLHNFCSALTAGTKIVVCTLQKWTGAGDAQRLIFNTNVRNNFAGYANALVDLAANAAFTDPTNTTYYANDQVHLTDAGYAVAGGLIQTALASI